jgi:hypothetical protein
MQDELYTDGIDEIMVSGTIVRVDLISLSPRERDANNMPKKVFRQRLIFSAEAFANSVEVMQNALQGLVDAGVVKRGAAAPQPGAETPTRPGNERTGVSTGTNQRPPNVSSNFR